MKKLILLVMMVLCAFPVWSADEWLKTRPASTDAWTAWPAANVANSAALDRVLANYREGMSLSYSSVTTISVSAGEVVCSNAAGTIRKMRQNTAATNVTFADIDTGAEEASKTYYIYANCDGDATTATFKVSLSATTPTGITSYKRLGTFYNNSASDISEITNDANIYSGLGTWTLKTNGVTYQAATDGFLVCTMEASASGVTNVIGYTDSSSAPTTVHASINTSRYDVILTGGSMYNSFTMPVKKGNYYKGVATTTYGTASTVVYYWIPNGN